MYTETSLKGAGHCCLCKYIAKPSQLDDLDMTLLSLLLSLLLQEYCNLPQNEYEVINQFRQIKNDYSSHNSRAAINQSEFKSLWSDITNLILRIDSSLQDNLVRLERRPLDETLCYKYSTEISGIQTKLEEIDCKLHRMELLLIENSKKLDDLMRMNSKERDESDEQTLNNEKENTHITNSSQVGPYAECSKARKKKEYEMIYSRSSDEQCQNLVEVRNSTEPHVGIDHTTSNVDGRKKNKIPTATEHDDIKECSSIKKVKRERALTNLSSEEEIPNLENVQHIKELNVSVQQKKEASFTLFSPGCNVSVGTIVMGNQCITVTSIDQMSETSSNSTSI